MQYVNHLTKLHGRLAVFQLRNEALSLAADSGQLRLGQVHSFALLPDQHADFFCGVDFHVCFQVEKNGGLFVGALVCLLGIIPEREYYVDKSLFIAERDKFAAIR